MQTATQILTVPVLSHALLFVNKSSADFKDLYSAFNSAAKAFRLKVNHFKQQHCNSYYNNLLSSRYFTSACVCTQILFVFVNVDEPRNGRLMEYFRVREFEAPLIRLVNLTDHVTYHLPSDTLDVETIKTFCRSYLEGKAKVKSTLISCMIHDRSWRNSSS